MVQVLSSVGGELQGALTIAAGTELAFSLAIADTFGNALPQGLPGTLVTAALQPVGTAGGAYPMSVAPLQGGAGLVYG